MFVVVADNVRSAHNIGSFFRSADSFSASAVFLTGLSPTPLTHEAQIGKTALGAEKVIPWFYYEDHLLAYEKLVASGCKIVVVEIAPNAVPLWDIGRLIDLNDSKLALIFGSEVSGVSSFWLNRADVVVAIPMLGKKESLNVAVVCGIVLYEIRRSLSS